MKIFLLILVGAVAATPQLTVPYCGYFLKFLPDQNCFIKEDLFRYNDAINWHYSYLKNNVGSYGKSIRIRNVTDPEILKKTQLAEESMTHFRHNIIAKLEAKFNEEGWYGQVFSEEVFPLSFSDRIGGTDDPLKDYLKSFKTLASLIDFAAYLAKDNYVYNNFQLQKLFEFHDKDQAQSLSLASIRLTEFEDVMKIGDPIVDSSNYRYWKPSRFDPENKDEKASPSVDHWSLGVLFYTILSGGEYPFAGAEREEYEKNLKLGLFEFDKKFTPEEAYITATLLTLNEDNKLSLEDLAKLINEMMVDIPEVPIKNPIKMNLNERIPKELIDAVDEQFRDFIKKLPSFKPLPTLKKIELNLDEDDDGNKPIPLIVILIAVFLFLFLVGVFIYRYFMGGPADPRPQIPAGAAEPELNTQLDETAANADPSGPIVQTDK